MKTVIFVIGAPGSGKSTLTKSFVESGYISLNRDSEGGKIIDLLPKMEKLLLEGKNIVLDNVFPTVEVRKPFIELAKKYNYYTHCVNLNTSIEDAQFNVVQRAIKLLNKFPTPEVIKSAKHTNVFPPLVLFKYRKEFEKPSVEEGFDKVEIIKFERKDDPTFTNKALILDYDSTLRNCINGNGKYPLEKDQIEIRPNVRNKIKEYKNNGYLLLGISNQSGVHKGDLTYDKAVELFEHTNKLLGFDIEFKFCPHQSAPISCYCRKPQVGTFVEFMLKHKLSRKDSIFVGDYTSDATMAKRAGIKYIHESEFFK